MVMNNNLDYADVKIKCEILTHGALLPTYAWFALASGTRWGSGEAAVVAATGRTSEGYRCDNAGAAKGWKLN